MYSVSVNLAFPAWHYLIGGDFGPENERNDHNYVMEAILEGAALDEHGFLVDITARARCPGRCRRTLRGQHAQRVPRVPGT